MSDCIFIDSNDFQEEVSTLRLSPPSHQISFQPAADFYGLTVGRAVGLIGSPFIFTCEEVRLGGWRSSFSLLQVVKDDTNQVCRLSGACSNLVRVRLTSAMAGRVDLRQGQPKPKGHLHWLDGREEAVVRVLVRSFGPLLLEDESNLGSPAHLEGLRFALN